MPTMLNPPQREAVAHQDGALLVFAGAGSGKTRVITFRIANLVAQGNVPPYRILAVTFTNKAAGEMRKRVGEILGPMASDVWVGTFHATCAKLLRLRGESIGVNPNFVIYDASDQKALMGRVLKELDLDDKRYTPKAVLGRVHKEKQEGRGPEDMSLDSYMDEAIQRAYRKYQAALASCKALDFEDIILKTVELAESKTDGGEYIRNKFPHILVDEFQDTNAAQYRLLRAFSNARGNLCVVGDDDQSIYRWRGADVRNIRGFRKDFPNATVIKLEQNYRSTQAIVGGALGIIARSATREPKELWTENPPGDPILISTLNDEREEAARVVQGIQEARLEGLSLAEIAVFYRVHAQSRVLEEALRSVNIPYQIVGGMKFYERAEVKDALSYLRLLVNPQSDMDLLRVLNVPARGIGKTTEARLSELASKAGVSLFDALGLLRGADESVQSVFQSGTKKKLLHVHALLEALQAHVSSCSPYEILDEVLAKTGYRAALEVDDSAEAEARLENLGELRGSMKDYAAEAEARGEAPTLLGFLERVSLQSDLDELADEARVTLMTVHGAKGLEFEVVFLTGMEEDMFPYRGMSKDNAFDAEELDEERRLAYVAVTRARKRLFISFAKMRQIFGTTRWGNPSRFLADIPQDLVRVIAAPRTSNAPGEYIRRDQAPDRAFVPRRPGPMPVKAQPVSAPGERFVDQEYANDGHHDAHDEESSWQRGSKVRHARFGEGEIRRILDLGEPAVIAFFPGWGEVKVLARFLSPGRG
jgi:DNA helicase II / ATP-dependent DNA helicase PcrA